MNVPERTLNNIILSLRVQLHGLPSDRHAHHGHLSVLLHSGQVHRERRQQRRTSVGALSGRNLAVCDPDHGLLDDFPEDVGPGGDPCGQDEPRHSPQRRIPLAAIRPGQRIETGANVLIYVLFI